MKPFTTFEEILQANGMRYTSKVTASELSNLRSFWETLLRDQGGSLSDADLDGVLSSYTTLGFIEKGEGDPTAQVRPEGGASPEENAAGSAPFEGSTSAPAEGSHASAGSGPQSAGNDAAPAPVITYTVERSDSHHADENHPILILEDMPHVLPHHQNGAFTNPDRRSSFEYTAGGRLHSCDILMLDRRFIRLVQWLGKSHIGVRLSGIPCRRGYAVYKIRAVDINSNQSIETANNDFLQLSIQRLLASNPPEDLPEGEEAENIPQDMLLTDMPSMVDFLEITGETLPRNILNWCHRNIALINTNTISPEEKRHAQRALSMMLHIRWKDTYFESIDPDKARRILNEELYGLEKVKQRVIETIIQINRTHTLPSYGLLLCGPAGTGKSQIAYAVAKILRLPWTSLDMSAIHDSEALTGSPRVYANAKPGKIMEAFSQAGASNLVFIINELDKSDARGSSGNPADALLTLLDGLGYTDNYIECTIPTQGVYPIATANDKSRISDPLLTRFAVIDIPDYTHDEKKIIFKKYSLPKVLRKMEMDKDECVIRDSAVDAIIDLYSDMPGVRDLEQAAEHLAANALFQIETKHLAGVTFNADDVRSILLS